jgi:hypothetical protein
MGILRRTDVGAGSIVNLGGSSEVAGDDLAGGAICSQSESETGVGDETAALAGV